MQSVAFADGDSPSGGVISGNASVAAGANGGSIQFAVVDNNFQSPTIAPLWLTEVLSLSPAGDTSSAAGSSLSGFAVVSPITTAPTAGTVGSLYNSSPDRTPTATMNSFLISPSSVGDETIGNSLLAPFSIAEFLTLNLAPNANLVATGQGALNSLTPAVPEPSTWAMMILGFLGIGFMTYRRRSGALRVA